MKIRTTDESACPPTAPGTSAQPVADSDLIDVSKLAREAGVKCPVAITRDAWADCVAWSEADNDRKGTVQDETGRLWDVLLRCSITLRHSDNAGRFIPFEVDRVLRAGRDAESKPAKLVAEVDFDNRGEPRLIIGLA